MRQHSSRASRRLRECGQVIAFITVLLVGLIAVAGLVEDGGRAISARLHGMDEAEAAARTGAQQLDLVALREKGKVTLDPRAAARAARQYLAAAGDAGDVVVADDGVHVTVHVAVSTEILGVFGMRTLTMSATGDARAEASPRRAAP
jgi:hypothetical protein